MKQIAFFGATGLLLVLSLLFYAGEIKKESTMEKSKIGFDSLLEYAKSASDLKDFLNFASTSAYTQLAIFPPTVDSLDGGDFKRGLDSSSGLSLHDMDEAIKALSEVEKGIIIITDPADTPLRYDRRFLQLKYEDNKILEVSPRSLY